MRSLIINLVQLDYNERTNQYRNQSHSKEYSGSFLIKHTRWKICINYSSFFPKELIFMKFIFKASIWCLFKLWNYLITFYSIFLHSSMKLSDCKINYCKIKASFNVVTRVTFWLQTSCVNSKTHFRNFINRDVVYAIPLK